jgi:hypothetical protein
MTDLEQLPPEQRAVLSLLLRQGKGYDDVASLLKVDADDVRGRAVSALTALGPSDLAGMPDHVRQEVGDYLLRQQSPAESDATRALFSSNPDARAWAEGVAGKISGLAAEPLPELPEARPAPPPGNAPAPVRDPDAPPAAKPRDGEVEAPAGGRRRIGRREAAAAAAGAAAGATAAEAAGAGATEDAAAKAERAAPRRAPRGDGVSRPTAAASSAGSTPLEGTGATASRVGGYIVLAALGVIIAVVIIVATNGGFSSGGGNDNAAVTGTTPATQTAHTATATGTPKIEAQINFTPPDPSSKALAVADIISQGAVKAFALTAQGLDPTRGFAYAVWLYNAQNNAKLLGFINQEVTANGQAKAIAALPADASNYREIIITKETAPKPTQPGTVVLTGQLGSAG